MSRCSRVDTGSVPPSASVCRRNRFNSLTRRRYVASSLALPASDDHAIVKFQIQEPVRLHVILRRRAVHAFDERAQLADMLGCRDLGESPPGPFVQRRAHFVDLVGFGHADLADEHAAILLQTHQSRLFERAKRLAHRASRYAERVGDVGFVELGAGREIAGKDHALELPLHQHGQRTRLDQRDGRARWLATRAPGRGTNSGQSWTCLRLDAGGCRLSTICNPSRCECLARTPGRIFIGASRGVTDNRDCLPEIAGVGFSGCAVTAVLLHSGRSRCKSG